MPPISGLEMHYQPVWQRSSGRLLYMEALLRAPQQSTERLFQAAYMANTSNQLERAALRLVWKDVQMGHIPAGHPIGVNLSQKALIEDLGCRRLLLHINQHVPLFLELTEYEGARHPTALRKRLVSLREQGIRLVMDDFGTGHANILTVLDIPFDFVKLDKGWRRWLPEPADNTLRIRRNIGLGLLAGLSGAGVPLIMEGVELLCLKLQPLLTELGVDYWQGFALGKPRRQAQPIPVGP